MKPQIIKDAEDNWPEDEASMTFDSFTKSEEEGCGDASEHAFNVVRLIGNRKHMHAHFSTFPDGADLIARYDAELKRLGIPGKVFA